MYEIIAARHAYPEPAGFSIKREKGHKNWTFLHFKSKMRIKIKGKTVITEPHACIIYQPTFPQYFIAETALEHDWIHFETDNENFLTEYGLVPNEIYYPEQHEFITRLTREIENEFNEQLSNRQKMLSIKMEELFIKLFRYASGQVAESIPVGVISSLSVLRERNFLSLEEKHTVKSMADRMGLSESRFFAVYKSHFGISPMDDLINARIESAKNLLSGSDEKIQSIAKRLGYAETTHFIRQFKKRTGKTPVEYRKS